MTREWSDDIGCGPNEKPHHWTPEEQNALPGAVRTYEIPADSKLGKMLRELAKRGEEERRDAE